MMMTCLHHCYSRGMSDKLSRSSVGLGYVRSCVRRMAPKRAGILRASAEHGRFSTASLSVHSIEYKGTKPAQPFGEQRMTFSFSCIDTLDAVGSRLISSIKALSISGRNAK